jgi:hypothetical protein
VFGIHFVVVFDATLIYLTADFIHHAFYLEVLSRPPLFHFRAIHLAESYHIFGQFVEVIFTNAVLSQSLVHPQAEINVGKFPITDGMTIGRRVMN